jgi:hypothetical protein
MNTYGVRGSGVSEGLDVYNRGTGDPIQATIDCVNADWERQRLDEREWWDFRSSPNTRQEIIDQACSLVEAYIAAPITAFEVVETEYIFRDHGWARADVIGRVAGGHIVPVDYKVKDEPNTVWLRQKIKSDFSNDHQLFHYAWAMNEEFGLDVFQYAIVILWYNSRPKIEYVPFIISPERMANWLMSAREIWRRMDAIKNGETEAWEQADHATKFGDCAFKKACLDYNRDENLMTQDYVERGPRG